MKNSILRNTHLFNLYCIFSKRNVLVGISKKSTRPLNFSFSVLSVHTFQLADRNVTARRRARDHAVSLISQKKNKKKN